MRVYILSGRKLLFHLGICLVAGAILLSGSVTYRKTIATAALPKQLPIYSVATKEKKIAITFDAAWGNSDTDQILAVLEKHRAKATFFITGEWADRYPEDVKRLYAAGHDIQNHSDAHPHVSKISVDALKKDTAACDQKIEKLIGKKPTLYRAPYGEYDNEMLSALQPTHKVIQWDVDSRDWQLPTAEEMIKNVTSHLSAGSILLFHNDIPATPTALDGILLVLDREGYQYVWVDKLIYHDQYEIDHTGKQIAK